MVDDCSPGRRNVRVIQLSSFLCAVGLSSWQYQILSIFLYKVVVPNTEQIGFIEGCQGLTQLVAGLSLGWATDKLGAPRRNLLLRCATLYSLVVLCFNAFCVLRLTKEWAWYLCCCLFAPAISVQRSLVESLFADSVPTGQRVRDYTTKRLCQLSGQMVGPLLQALIFTLSPVEDAWTRTNLSALTLSGIAVFGAGCLTQFAVDQEDTLGLQSEAVQVQEQEQPLLEVQRNAAVVRWTILFYDVVRVCFGGLAVKYYGLYFEETFGMSPAKFTWLQATSMASMGIFAQFGGFVCRRGYARTWVCLGLLLLNNTGNFVIAYGRTQYWAAAGWVLREGALNGVFHLKQSLLMDHTPKSKRGMWNSVDCLNSSFWSGSALFGGWLVRVDGFQVNFLVMAWGFILATAIWTFLLVRVGKA